MDALIKIQDLHKSFDKNKVLDGISIDIEKGCSLIIVGRSGSGKSVLLKHINRLIQPDSGAIFIEGQDISRIKARELVEVRKNIGMLFQSAALLDSLTVEENVGLGLREGWDYSRDKIKSLVEEKLEMVGLGGAGNLYPADLSGGMRKRVGLARAIAASPRILLYDEPTTGLDPMTSDLINKLIVDLNNRLEATSVTVTHDMKVAEIVGDRVVMLHQGQFEFDGTPGEMKTSKNAIVRQFIEGRADGPIQLDGKYESEV